MFSVCVDFVCFTYFSYLVKYFILTLKRYVCKIESNIVTLSTKSKEVRAFVYQFKCLSLFLSLPKFNP